MENQKLRLLAVAKDSSQKDKDWNKLRALEGSISTLCERLVGAGVFKPTRHYWQLGAASEIVQLEDEKTGLSVLRDARGELFMYCPRQEPGKLMVRAWRSLKDLKADMYSDDRVKRKSVLEDFENIESVLRQNLNKRPAV